MDEFKQVGPEKPMYVGDVIAVAKKLARRDVVNVKFAARSTSRHVVLALLPMPVERLRAEDSIFYGAAFPEGFSEQPGIFVAIDNGRAAWLPATGDLHHGYVGGYLERPFGDNDDDHPLTNFINDVAQYIYGAGLAFHRAHVEAGV